MDCSHFGRKDECFCDLCTQTASNILRSMVLRTVTRKDHLQPCMIDASFQEWAKNTGKISFYCLKNAPSLIQSHLSQQTDQLYYGDIKRPHCCAGDTTALQSSRSSENRAVPGWRTSLWSEVWPRRDRSQPSTAQHTLLCLHLRQIFEATEPAAELRWGFAKKYHPWGWCVTSCGVSIWEQPARLGIAGSGDRHGQTWWGRPGLFWVRMAGFW